MVLNGYSFDVKERELQSSCRLYLFWRKRVSLNIGFDGHVLTGKFQGTRTTLSKLLQALDRELKGENVYVYSEDPNILKRELITNNIVYKELPVFGSVRRLIREFPILFRRDKIDLGVFQYMCPLRGQSAVFIHDLLPLSHPHLFPWRVRIRTAVFFTISIYRAKLIFVVSDFTRKQVITRYGFARKKVAVILNGPSFSKEVYGASATPCPTRYVLTVGRIEPRKNIPLLVAAFQKAAVPDVRLIVVGSPDLGYRYQPPKVESIDFVSGLDDSSLINLYRGASLFVYPSEAEGFGVPLLDATLFGLPVISSNRTVLTEVGGDLVEYFDPTAKDAVDILAKRISAHFNGNPVVAANDTQRKLQAEKFSWENAARSFLKAVHSQGHLSK